MADWAQFFRGFLSRKKSTKDSITYMNKGMPGEDKAELFRIQALARRKKKDLDGALQKYNEAIQCNPRSSALHMERSEVKMQKSDIKGAYTDLEKAVSLDPHNPEVYKARSVFRKKMGDEKNARADLEKAKTLALQQKEEAGRELGDAQSYLLRGEKKMEHRDFAGALADFDRAILLNPKEGGAYLSRGALKQVTGDQDGARKDFQKAKECEKQAEKNSH